MISSCAAYPGNTFNKRNTTSLDHEFQRPVLEVARVMLDRVNGLSGATVDRLGQITRYWTFFNSNHDSKVAVRSSFMSKFPAPTRADPASVNATHAPQQGELEIKFNTETDRGAYAYAQEMAKQTIMAMQVDCRTVDAAIYVTARRYKLGSFLKKLWKDEPAVPRYDRIKRLERAHRDALRCLRERFA